MEKMMSTHAAVANELIEEAKRLGVPTTGEFAVRMWEWSNHEADASFAAETMRKAGYTPFCGYPLHRGSSR